MKKLGIVGVLLLVLVCPRPANAEPFEGGRDVLMLGAGVINLSLLAVIIYQALKKPTPKVEATTPQPPSQLATPEVMPGVAAPTAPNSPTVAPQVQP